MFDRFKFAAFCAKYPGYTRAYALRKHLGLGVPLMCGYMLPIEFTSTMKLKGKTYRGKLLDLRESSARPVISDHDLKPGFFFKEFVH